ncbi:LytR/AlgR family response regulator transcription factor [Sinomicrobium sp. M5D2P17]
MKIIIIEDELKAARSLEHMIGKLRPEAEILTKLQSVDGAISYFAEHKLPDLIFMDIQLSDGSCFEIFKNVKITCPVIFCTAYGEYGIEAIKANGIDYVLKPFSENELEKAFERVEALKNFFQKDTSGIDLDQLIQKIGVDEGKKSFLVFKNEKYTILPTEHIAYIYIKYHMPTMVTFEGVEYDSNQSLDQLQQQLSPKQFYRLNRQYLIQFSAVKEVEHYFSRKLLVKLRIPTPENLLIGKEKTTTFLQWLDGR